jgi:hypothetical protein
MPKAAQMIGMVVTALVVFGTDLDVLIAVPLGVLAGAVMTFILALGEAKTEKN